MKMNRKKWMITLLVVLVAFAMPLSAQAASQKTKAIKAYKIFLSKAMIPWDDDWNVRASRCSFGLAYIDGDNVPELIVSTSDVSHAAGYGRIYAYKNGQVKRVANLAMNDSKCSYYKKKGVVIDTYAQGGSTKNYKKLTAAGLTTKLAVFSNVAKVPWLPKGTSYYKMTGYTNKKVSKATFHKELKKLVGNKKATKVSMRKNTVANRKKYLK